VLDIDAGSKYHNKSAIDKLRQLLGVAGIKQRLPLQPGFAFLDQKMLEVEHERYELSATKALEFFVDTLNGCANTRHDFHQLRASVERLPESKEKVVERVTRHNTSLNVVRFRRTPQVQEDGAATDAVKAIFQVLPPGIKVDVWLKGRAFYTSGLTGSNQRAEAIFCIGHYLFYGDPEYMLPALGYGYEQERQWAIEQILSDKHHG
jgi:hypothetical protein